MLVAKIMNLMEIHNCVSLLDRLYAATGAVTPVLFCLLLLKFSITTCLSPLYNFFFIQNLLSPLLFPGHNLKCALFKESKVLFLTQKNILSARTS